MGEQAGGVSGVRASSACESSNRRTESQWTRTRSWHWITPGSGFLETVIRLRSTQERRRSDELDAATREEREAFTRTVELVRQRWSTARIYRVLGVFNDYRVQYQVRA